MVNSDSGPPQAPVESAIPEQVGSLIRTMLTTAGGAAVTDGLITKDQLTSIVGGLMVLVTLGWSWWKNRQVKRAKAAAVTAAANHGADTGNATAAIAAAATSKPADLKKAA